MPLFVIIDASLVAVPNFARTVDEAHLIVQRIAYWSKQIAADRQVQPLSMSDTVEVLATGNYFPSSPNITALLDLFALRSVYSTEDVRHSINTILDRAGHVIGAFGIEVSKCSNFTAAPSLDEFAADAPLFDSGIRSLSSALSAAGVGTTKIPFVAPGFPVRGDAISVRGQVDAALQNGAIFQLPYSVYGEVRLVEEVTQVAVQLGADFLWRTSIGAAQLHFAIATKIVELARAGGASATLRDVPAFAIGSEFVASLHGVGAAGEHGQYCGVVLETCARAILGTPKYQIADFRRGRGRNSGVRTRPWDQAEAKRTHVTKSHAALRLMFWERTDRSIELANVGQKREEVILEGVAAGVIEFNYSEFA